MAHGILVKVFVLNVSDFEILFYSHAIFTSKCTCKCIEKQPEMFYRSKVTTPSWVPLETCFFFFLFRRLFHNSDFP